MQKNHWVIQPLTSMAIFFHFCNVANKVSIIHKPILSNSAIKKMKKKILKYVFGYLLEPCIEICLSSFFELLDFLAESYWICNIKVLIKLMGSEKISHKNLKASGEWYECQFALHLVPSSIEVGLGSVDALQLVTC